MKTAAVGLALAAWSGRATAQIPFPYGGTEVFNWAGSGSVWSTQHDLGGFSFMAGGNSLIHVEDCCLYGDAFDIWINGAFAFATPSVPTDGSAGYSMADWVVGPGSYIVDIFVRDNPWGSGGAYLSIGPTTNPVSVPEPGSIVLIASGLFVLAGAGKMRRRIMG
jgi:hypothetical protein